MTQRRWFDAVGGRRDAPDRQLWYPAVWITLGLFALGMDGVGHAFLRTAPVPPEEIVAYPMVTRVAPPEHALPPPLGAEVTGPAAAGADHREDCPGLPRPRTDYPRVHHSHMMMRRQEPSITYPPQASARGLGRQRCRVEVWVDASGHPQELEVTKCDEVFHPSVRSALCQWRWYPARDPSTREAMKARFALGVTFQPAA